MILKTTSPKKPKATAPRRTPSTRSKNITPAPTATEEPAPEPEYFQIGISNQELLRELKIEASNAQGNIGNILQELIRIGLKQFRSAGMRWKCSTEEEKDAREKIVRFTA